MAEDRAADLLEEIRAQAQTWRVDLDRERRSLYGQRPPGVPWYELAGGRRLHFLVYVLGRINSELGTVITAIDAWREERDRD